MIRTCGMSLYDIDNTDVESIIGLLGYRQRLTIVPHDDKTSLRQIRIGKRIYRKADIDSVNWL